MKWERGDEKSFSFRSLKLSPPNVDPFSSQSFQHEKEKKTHLQLVDAPDAIAFAKDYSLMTFGLLLPAVNDGSFSVFTQNRTVSVSFFAFQCFFVYLILRK